MDGIITILVNIIIRHCEKSVHIRSYSGPQFCALGLNTERHAGMSECGKNAEQDNSEYGHFLRS